MVGPLRRWLLGHIEEEYTKMPPQVQAYLLRMSPTFREFGGEITTAELSRRVYLSPMDEFTGRFAAPTIIYLNNNGIPTVYSLYYRGHLYLPQGAQRTAGPNKLILIDERRNDQTIDRLKSAATFLLDYNIDDVLYSWWYERAGSERIRLQLNDM